MTQYWHWLVAVSVVIAVAERLRPARRTQPVLRKQLANDLFYLAFNGHLWAVVTGGVIGAVASTTGDALDSLGLVPAERLLDGAPIVTQCLTYFVVSDFLQWYVHRLLHAVPWLWQFHKVHHSVHDMDWAANFRFHWMELVVYRSLLYVPIVVWLGGSGEAIMIVAVFATAWGHFNHANLDVGLGPLGYVFNSPRMHMWHHDATEEGRPAKNFGIVLSAWDFLFHTAYWPRDRAPARVGYPHDQEMPADVPRQFLFPLTRSRG